MTPEQMRALADEFDEEAQEWDGEGVVGPKFTNGAAALRAAAAQLAAVRGLLQTSDPGNPYTYDPWADESVDPTNTDDVVRAAVSAGWAKGEYELSERVRAALKGEVSDV